MWAQPNPGSVGSVHGTRVPEGVCGVLPDGFGANLHLYHAPTNGFDPLSNGIPTSNAVGAPRLAGGGISVGCDAYTLF